MKFHSSSLCFSTTFSVVEDDFCIDVTKLSRKARDLMIRNEFLISDFKKTLTVFLPLSHPHDQPIFTKVFDVASSRFTLSTHIEPLIGFGM